TQKQPTHPPNQSPKRAMTTTTTTTQLPSSSASDLLSVPLPHNIDDISNICWSPPDFRYDSEWLMGCSWDGRLFGYTVHDFYAGRNVNDGFAHSMGGGVVERTVLNRVFCEPKFDIAMHDLPLLSCEMNRVSAVQCN